MGDLVNPVAPVAAVGQWQQLGLDKTASAVKNDGSSGTITMSSMAFPAATFDVSQALLIEFVWLYTISTANDVTGVTTISVNESQQVGGLIASDVSPASGISVAMVLGAHQYLKCRLTLQSLGATSVLDGYNESAAHAANTGRQTMSPFGWSASQGTQIVLNPLAINMANAFTIAITAATAGAGVGNITLTQTYCRYVKLGP